MRRRAAGFSRQVAGEHFRVCIIALIACAAAPILPPPLCIRGGGRLRAYQAYAADAAK